jgi:hypothetical protein
MQDRFRTPDHDGDPMEKRPEPLNLQIRIPRTEKDMATTPGEYDVASQHRNDELNNPVGAFGLKIVLICPNDHYCTEMANCLYDAQ